MPAEPTPACPPTLGELTRRLLNACPDELPASEVEPYHQALPHQWIDPALLWPDALAAAALLLPEDDAVARGISVLKMPAAWGRRLGEMAGCRLAPCALGHAPAQVRDITPLLAEGTAALRRGSWPAAAAARADDAADSQGALEQRLLEAALARLEGRISEAAAMLERLAAEAPESCRSLLENETAALLWCQGHCRQAEESWNDSAAAFSPVFQFNRAIAALQRGDVQTAEPLLRACLGAFPADRGWHHLAQLYLTLIEMN